jgi:sterol desaturase/sphingolipid hydroxylase (fatty acid hydroxylase superfamily)
MPRVSPATAAWLTALVLLVVLERLSPLRRWREGTLERLARNAALGGVSAVMVTLLQSVALVPVVAWAEARGIGLLHLVALPVWLETVLAVVLLDYTLWHWHRWNHRFSLLWRFHLVHHTDRDLDASTGLRFHFGEMALSVPFRAAQVLLVGAGAAALWLWTGVLLVSVLFHHSNLRLPLGVERALAPLLVTPRMHGIHHSEQRRHSDSNFSSLLSVWDRLHRTLLLDVPQQALVIGVPGERDRRRLGLRGLLALPFQRRPDAWAGQPPPADARLATEMAP